MKTRKWHLTVHISVMGFVGSLMIPLVIGVEASVGATDKIGDHSLTGLILLCWFFLMVFAGRIRYLMLSGHKVGRRRAFLSKVIHIYGGYVILGLAFWNCYTGMIRIGPEDSYFEIIVFSSVSMGYDINIFGIVRKFIFFPYVAVVVLAFSLAEFRLRRNHTKHQQQIQGYLTGTVSIWDDGAGALQGSASHIHNDDRNLETMTIETFLDAARLGKDLCIVDGRVIDITNFMDAHPGGREVLRFAAGTDITQEIFGERDVDGISHIHSPGAIKLLKSLVKAKLVHSDGISVTSSHGAISQDLMKSAEFQRLRQSRPNPGIPVTKHAFRSARVVAIKYLTPGIELDAKSKPVVMLRLSIPNSNGTTRTRRSGLFGRESHYDESSHNDGQDATFLPGSAFTFRTQDNEGNAIDRQYTPINIDAGALGRLLKGREDSRIDMVGAVEEDTFDFLISLIPGGKMSKVLTKLKIGKTIRVQGPKVSPDTLKCVNAIKWKSMLMFAAGTGIAPMLQLVDSFLDTSNGSERSSTECPK